MDIMPIQPIVEQRFVPNRIVQTLLERGPFDMNNIACLDFTDQERIQFAQLIGYSLGGFSELSYVDEETYEAAENMAKGMSELKARNKYLRGVLAACRTAMKPVTTLLYRIHEDDLID